jgi:cell division protein FtsZ
MKKMAEVKPDIETVAKIRVVGVGGSGSSAVNRMVSAKVKGVEFIVMNTDVQALHYSKAPKKIHIGKTVTRGLGAGMNPELGRKSAEESQNEIKETLKDSDMVFITCGLGGGTGSGGAPVVADIAREAGALTIAVVTRPFTFEGVQRKNIADQAYDELQDKVDACIVVPNDRILQIVDKQTTLIEAFQAADEVLRQGVEGIAELITQPGLVNVDFADVKSIMQNAGTALMGIGRASGEDRAINAAKAAVTSPLLETSLDGARGVLFVVTGGPDLAMHEVSEAAKVVTSTADENARVIFGTVIDENLKDEVHITVIATGFSGSPRQHTREERVQAEKHYRPNPVVERYVPEEDNDDEPEIVEPRKEIFEKKASRPLPPLDQPNKSNDKEEDLDIPAFIRRKMK